MQGFQDILPRGKRRVFTPIFPKNAKLFLLYETDKTAGKDVSFHWQDKAEQGHFLHRFNAASGVQKCTPSEPQNIQKYGKRAHSSVSTTFGLKLHLVLNASRKFVKFSLKPGNLHDVSCAEEVLAGCTGTVVGDGGYVSTVLRDSLAKKGIRLIAKHRQNMVPNSREEKRFLKKRSAVETMIGRFKSFFAETLSRSRSPQSFAIPEKNEV